MNLFEHSYEEAPATKFLATHCCVCGRFLLEAESVETGIGPICRAKYGYDKVAVSAAVKDEANKLIYQAAALQKGIEFYKIAERLAELGFSKIAEILKKRAKLKVEVRIKIVEPFYRLEAPYNAEAVAALKKIPGRFYNEVEEVLDGKKVKKKYNFVPTVRKQALFDIIRRYYSGLTAEGPKGFFTIEPLE